MEADRQAQHVKNRDALVKSLASYLEMDGYERTPFSERQLQSFHRQVIERQDHETEVINKIMVSIYKYRLFLVRNIISINVMCLLNKNRYMFKV